MNELVLYFDDLIIRFDNKPVHWLKSHPALKKQIVQIVISHGLI